ncbi:MAG TPA: rRNA maturation RNase YbeY [Syntrophobacter fumaroxidans]|nr:rRNA maturation RNase YbeY [Syntrophobacter fumaroxidans]
MPLIQISEKQSRIETNRRRIKSAANRILNALGFTDAELSILIVDDEEMAGLNSTYRRKDTSTDVLSFPMREGEFGDVCEEVLGDVVICAPMAKRMSELHGASFESVMDLLLVHGILHLVGHDHEQGREEAARMADKTMQLLKMLGHSVESFAWYVDGQD